MNLNNLPRPAHSLAVFKGQGDLPQPLGSDPCSQADVPHKAVSGTPLAPISPLPGKCHPTAGMAESAGIPRAGHTAQATRAPWDGTLTLCLTVLGSPMNFPTSQVLFPQTHHISSSWSPCNQQSQLRLSGQTIPHLQKNLSCSPIHCVILPPQTLHICPFLKVVGFLGDSLTLLYLHNPRGTPTDLTNTSPFASRLLIKTKINLDIGELHQ